MTMVKWCSEDVVRKEKPNTIYPPRDFLNQLSEETRKNLKPLSTRPVHPATLNHDPVPHLCAVATGCFLRGRDEGNQDGGGESIRGGPSWVGSNEGEAWRVMFMCVVGCITNPSCLLQVWEEDNNNNNNNKNKNSNDNNGRDRDDDVTKLMPGPDVDELKAFRLKVEQYQWMSRWVHPIFRKELPTSAMYFNFLQVLCSGEGKEIFMTAARSKASRSSRMDGLRRKINDCCSVSLTAFQVQVIFRTIECCINEPFGQIDYVPTGPGGLMGERCLVNDFTKMGGPFRDSPPQHMKADLATTHQIPFWLLSEFNRRVEGVMDSNDKEAKSRMEDELTVCFLEWNKKEKCLYHTMGIRRKLNECDMEHLMCLLSTCHQFTLSARNGGSSNSLDCEKHHPLKFESKERLARDLPFMRMMVRLYPAVKEALIRLLEDSAFEFRRLSDEFRIDSDQQE
jgi:hypothetical protein